MSFSRTIGLPVFAIALLVTVFPALCAEESGDLPVMKVELFSSGVGYFEHFGKVEGTDSLDLRFKTNQINDVLKSLILQDLDGGMVSTVVYPSKDPLSKILQSFQVDLSSEPSLADLLSQLRGAEVTVTAQAEEVNSTILGLEQRPKQATEDGEILEVWVLNLISGGTIRALELEKIQTLDLKDAELQEELNEALLTMSQARGADTKQIALNFAGEGERRVRVGYLVETPIWKTSYRLVMPEADDEDEAYLQGWAIVENQTDNDWNGVELSLVSGRPISFIQDLYQPLYLPRPVVHPELQASLRPQEYDFGLDLYDFVLDGEAEPSELRAMRREGLAAPAPAAPQEKEELVIFDAQGNPLTTTAAQTDVRRFGYAGGMGAMGGLAMDPTASVAAAASAGQVGELFRYTVGDVSLPRQKSAMIPIVTDSIEAERVSIYNEGVHQKHPLNGARMKNTTGKHLLQGPITVLDEDTYAGDARIGNLPPGQERLLSYAVDLEVLVDSTKNREDSELQSGKIVKGILQLSKKRVASRDYLIENKSEKDKVLIVEHPLRNGWRLVDTPDPVEVTESLYRFRFPVEASKTALLTVKEEMTRGESIALLPTDVGRFEFYTRADTIPADVREGLVQAIQLKSALVDIEREIQIKRARKQEISGEQERIRANMGAIEDTKSSYYTRLLKKLDDQESEIERIDSEIAALEERLADQRRALEEYLSNLNLG